MFDFCLIIPCFNELPRVKGTLKSLTHFFSTDPYWKGKKVVCVFANDGSADGTAEAISTLPAAVDGVAIHTVSYEKNHGKGYAIISGVKAVDALTYGFIDADLPFHLSALSAMHTFCVQWDCVVGKRVGYIGSLSWYARLRLWVSELLRKFVKYILGLAVEDTQCGIKMFSRRIALHVVPLLTEFRFSFDVELLTRVAQSHLTIKEHPVVFRYGTTSHVRWSDGVRFILDIVGLTDRLRGAPSRSFFVALGFLSLATTVAVFGWTPFKGFFFSDDFTWLWHGAKIDGSLYRIVTFRMSTFYSPVLNALYTFFFPVFTFHAQWYFAVGLLVHTLVSWCAGLLVFVIARQRSAALIATTLIAFAGSAYEPLVWIGANMHSIAALFIVLSVLAYAYFFDSGRAYHLVISFVSFLFALGTKEIAIVTPALLLTFAFTIGGLKKKLRNLVAHILFWLCTCAVSVYYLIFQYGWQRDSVWVTQKVWTISWDACARVPTALVDMLVPMKPLLAGVIVVPVYILSAALLVYIVVRYHRITLVRIGLLWSCIAIAPVIFFATAHWYDPLPSRYTYLARIGMMMTIAGIVSYHVIHNTSRRIINWFACVLSVAVIVHIFYMSHVIRTEYGYVYASGRTLLEAARQIQEVAPHRVYVAWERPFTTNIAHIVGVMELVSRVPEKDVVFLSAAEMPCNECKGVYLFWSESKRRYEWRQL